MSIFETLFTHSFDAYARGGLVFLSPIPGEARLALTVVLLALAWAAYRSPARRMADTPRRWLFGVRCAFIIVLMFVLGAPALRVPNPREGAVFIPVLTDTSQSMSICDSGYGDPPQSRLQAAQQLLAGQLLRGLERHARTVVYSFHDRAERAPVPETLQPVGVRTDVLRAVRDVDADLRGVPVASVVLLTDGCRNAGGGLEDAAHVLQARGVPLHVVGLGDPDQPRDYEVFRAAAPRRVRSNTEVAVRAIVRHTDFSEAFELRLVRDGTRLLSKRVQPKPGSDSTAVQLLFTPDHEGHAVYKLEVPADDRETITENNTREFTIDIEDDRLPVLYIEGSPRLEYRFLRRALFRDPNFRLVGLLRLANDRFYVQGAHSDEKYLAQGFPDSAERLFAFQAVILGDVEASCFTAEQLELLGTFARERGGGVLMLGGVSSFGRGQYAATPVADMLPVRISPSDGMYADDDIRAVPTPEGLEHPVMRLAPDPDANRRLWGDLPDLIGITPVAGVKPGATTLLVRHDDHQPVLVCQRYGRGRVAAFTSGGSWYWQVSMPASNEIHEKFWKQLVRWLAAGASQQLSADVLQTIVGHGEPVYIRATALGRDLRPVNDAAVLASITDPFGNVETVPLGWVLEQEGVYQCRYVPGQEGDYVVSVHVDGWPIEPVGTGFLVAEPQTEFTNASLKEAGLRAMAEATGGGYFTVDDVDDLVDAVRHDVVTARFMDVEPRQLEMWHCPFLFALLLTMVTTEWGLRRKAGLA